MNTNGDENIKLLKNEENEILSLSLNANIGSTNENGIIQLEEQTVDSGLIEQTESNSRQKKNKIDAKSDLNAFLENLAQESETSLAYIKFLKSLTEQDKNLPLNNVANIMKSVLPEGTKISKDAKQLMQECCSELISFITSESTEIVSVNKRKTVMGDDIISSLYNLGFENYGEIMKIYLQKYRELQLLKQLATSLLDESGGKGIKKQKKTPN
ncbi:hypothetical protein QEN19_001703 [Hanseniaspora menglaensis]